METLQLYMGGDACGIVCGNHLTIWVDDIVVANKSWSARGWHNIDLRDYEAPYQLRIYFYSGTTDVWLDNISFINITTLDNELPADQTMDKSECPVSSCAEKQNFVGDPINTYSGNFNYRVTDFSIPTLGQPLRLERTYNSLATLTDTVVYSRPLGYGWTHNYQMDLTFFDAPYGEPETVILQAPHGSRMRFTDNRDGTYTPFPGVTAEMVRREAITHYNYVVTTTNQTVYTFEGDESYFAPQVLTFTQKLTATNGITDDYFGRSVAIDEDTLAIGAYKVDNDQGAVYIFGHTGSDWSQQAVLTADDGTADDYFGYSVAVSKDIVVVGAYGDDTQQGSAYIFKRSGSTWSQQDKLTADDGQASDLGANTVALLAKFGKIETKE